MDILFGFLDHEKFSMKTVKRYSHEDISESMKKVGGLMIELAKNFDQLIITIEKINTSNLA